MQYSQLLVIWSTAGIMAMPSFKLNTQVDTSRNSAKLMRTNNSGHRDDNEAQLLIDNPWQVQITLREETFHFCNY